MIITTEINQSKM